jgi:SanA protein
VKKKIFKILKITTVLLLLGGLSIPVSNYLVTKRAENKIFNNVAKVPFNNVGLLLGTSKVLPSGHTNLYYTYRIDAAIKLYNAGKIKFILVSGDNGNKKYDEPTTIKDDLVSRGIPASKIFLDYAGFRTLDSVVRSDKIFGQKSITVISQKFHNERALFIASTKDLKAVGFNAKDVSARYGKKTMIRERLARVKMMLDLIFGKSPKFLGPKITIQ